jgi:hypothetical protein
VSEADADIAWLVPFADLVARNWESLRDPVVQIIKRAGGKTVSGLRIINKCRRDGLLELGLMPPDGTTMRRFSKTENLTIRAPDIHPAEGVRVEPYMAGDWFIRRANPAEPISSASEPTARAEGSIPESTPLVESPLAPGSAPKLELPVEPPQSLRRPEEAKAWLAEQIATDSPGKNKNEWARRKYLDMQRDFGKNIPWIEGTLRRRMDD